MVLARDVTNGKPRKKGSEFHRRTIEYRQWNRNDGLPCRERAGNGGSAAKTFFMTGESFQKTSMSVYLMASSRSALNFAAASLASFSLA